MKYLLAVLAGLVTGISSYLVFRSKANKHHDVERVRSLGNRCLEISKEWMKGTAEAA